MSTFTPTPSIPSSRTAIWSVERAATLVDILRYRAANQPHDKAYTFLADRETKELSLTYAEFDLRARAVAAWLQEHAEIGDRVLLLYPPWVGIYRCVLRMPLQWYDRDPCVPAAPLATSENTTQTSNDYPECTSHRYLIV